MTLLRLAQQMSSRKALSYIGASNNTLYYTSYKKRPAPINQEVAAHAKRFSQERPAYGICRLAVVTSWELKRPVNHKQVQRICQKTGIIMPATTKKEAVKRGSRKVKASRPHEI